MQNGESNSDPRRAVMKSLGDGDYAAQETLHHLLSLKLHSSSLKVMPVNLNGSPRVHDIANIDEGESALLINFLISMLIVNNAKVLKI